MGGISTVDLGLVRHDRDLHSRELVVDKACSFTHFVELLSAVAQAVIKVLTFANPFAVSIQRFDLVFFAKQVECFSTFIGYSCRCPSTLCPSGPGLSSGIVFG